MNYAAAILNFVLTATVAVVCSIPAFGMMIILMNGFHENDAQYGINIYWIWVILIGLLVSALSALAGFYLSMKKDLNPFLGGLISFLIAMVIQVGVVFVGVFIGLTTADLVRTGF